MLLTNKDDENDSTLWSIVHKPDYLKFRFIRSKVDECANDRRSIRFYCELSESGLDFYHKPAKTALRKLTVNWQGDRQQQFSVRDLEKWASHLKFSKRPQSPIPLTPLPPISHPQLDGLVPTARSERLAVGREGD